MKEVLRIDKLDFSKLIDPKSGTELLPVIVDTGRTATLAFMNQAALTRTLEEGVVTFFSRTSGQLWTKGETSGNFLKVASMVADCDNDTLLIEAQASGPVCHTGTETCFD